MIARDEEVRLLKEAVTELAIMLRLANEQIREDADTIRELLRYMANKYKVKDEAKEMTKPCK